MQKVIAKSPTGGSRSKQLQKGRERGELWELLDLAFGKGTVLLRSGLLNVVSLEYCRERICPWCLDIYEVPALEEILT